MGKITVEQAQQIIDEFYDLKSINDISVKYGISRGYVTHIATGRVYSHLHRPDDRDEIIERRKLLGCSKVTLAQAQQVIDDFVAFVPTPEIIAKFGIRASQISRIVLGGS